MNTSQPSWLFVSYGGGHVKALLPVALRVKELGIARPIYLALTTAAAAVRKTGIETLGFKDLFFDSDDAARICGELLVAQLQVQAADRQESVAYLGLSYVDLQERLGAEEAASQYAQFGRQAFLPLGILERAIGKLQPALVVATNSPRAEQAAIFTARRMGVPSVCLLDLLGIWERELLARPDYADAICVLNDSVRESLIVAGRPAADVHVTGNPAFDTVNAPALVSEGIRRRHDAGWDGLYVCLYASSPEPRNIPGVMGTGDPEFPRRIERELVNAVLRDDRLALWIRRHPSEPPALDVASMAHPRIRVSGSDMPLHAALHASDEVVVTVSTVGVEAQLAGKAVTQVRGSILDHLSPYLRMGIAGRELQTSQIRTALDPDDLRAARVRAGDSATIFRSATDRVVEVLRQVAGSER